MRRFRPEDAARVKAITAAAFEPVSIDAEVDRRWPGLAPQPWFERKWSGMQAQIAGQPYGLARALEKLDAYSKRLPMAANPATAHMFIVAPFTGQAFMKLFSTHPPVAERVRRLLGR